VGRGSKGSFPSSTVGVSGEREERRRRTCIVGMKIGIEDVCGLAVGGDDEGGEVVGDWGVVWGRVHCVDGWGGSAGAGRGQKRLTSHVCVARRTRGTSLSHVTSHLNRFPSSAHRQTRRPHRPLRAGHIPRPSSRTAGHEKHQENVCQSSLVSSRVPSLTPCSSADGAPRTRARPRKRSNTPTTLPQPPRLRPRPTTQNPPL
jgi:hypothetical protein